MAERRRSFYAHWVQQFFNDHQGKGRRRDLGRADIEAFLEALASDPDVADWQVAQARDALEVYYEQFRGIALDPTQKTDTCGAEVSGQASTDRAALGERGGSKSAVDELRQRVPAPRVLELPETIPPPTGGQSGGRLDMSALEQAARSALRTEHYALKTEKAYVHWIRRFVAYHHGKRPSDMSGERRSTSFSATWPLMNAWPFVRLLGISW